MQRYQLLTQAEIEQIHANSLRIMENVGIVFSYEPARDLLAKHGAKVEGHTVYFPPQTHRQTGRFYQHRQNCRPAPIPRHSESYIL